VPDDRILKSEAETGCLCMCLGASILDMVGIELFFQSKARLSYALRYVCECVGVFGKHTMRYSIDT
jgi:hypothetical protein